MASSTRGQQKRPSKAKIGYQTFDIKWIHEKEWLNSGYGEDKSGHSWWGTGLIAIRLESTTELLTENALREVLLHEILHMAYQAGGLDKCLLPDDEEEREEQAISMLSFPVLQILMENTSVIDYLMGR